MKTLTTPISTQRDAIQSGWCELYDFYLKSPITTPFGTTSILRLTTNPAGFNFFTPKVSPESAGTQGNAQAYSFWPLKRQLIKGSNKFTNDKLAIAASNVSQDWVQMLADVDWEAVPVVIRKISTTIASPTADDCAVIFSGSIDSVKVTLQQLQFTVSNDFGTFNVLAPRENMHANCRFNWGDDQCTMIRYLAANYKSKTVGSGSTTTNVKSLGLTEDTGSSSGYDTDYVNALPDASITTSSHAPIVSNANVYFISNGADFVFIDSTNRLAVNQAVTFSGTTMPGTPNEPGGQLVAGKTYYIFFVVNNTFFFLKKNLADTTGMTFTTSGSGVKLTTINADDGYFVKASNNGGFWAMNGTADWGTNSQGYWQIADAGAGIHNRNLTPWIQFDFGSGFNTPLRLWRICGRQDGDREALPRLLLFYSSTTGDFTTGVTLEGYFECPPRLGTVASPQLFDVLLPNAQGKRYWRICVRSRWSDTIRTSMLYKVSAYSGSRHYWQDGQITFAGDITPALRNITRTIRESYSGELVCAPLPVAPASGDTFTIERGCARTFNACAARGNYENFGGFDSMPFETVIR